MTYATLADIGRHFIVHESRELRTDYWHWLMTELSFRGHARNVNATLVDLVAFCEHLSDAPAKAA